MLDAGKVESAMETLSGTGQFDGSDNEGEATPAERTDAFMAGFESGMASSCDPYLQSDDAAEQ
jgi:predicted metalloprotease